MKSKTVKLCGGCDANHCDQTVWQIALFAVFPSTEWCYPCFLTVLVKYVNMFLCLLL